MSIIRQGRQTLCFDPPPRLVAAAAVAGPEAQSWPERESLDEILPYLRFPGCSFEQSEARLLERAITLTRAKAGAAGETPLLCCGDLINQISPSCRAACELNLPFWGLFAACATIGEALSVAAVAVASGAAESVLAAACSHACTAERQFRYPNEYGSQKPPCAQLTLTASGAALLSMNAADDADNAPRLTRLTVGRVRDAGITDPFQVGAAMAPAFASTVAAHLQESKTRLQDYDLILSGDLGRDGSALARQLLTRQGVDVHDAHFADCGLELSGAVDRQHAGASGAGCAAAYLAGPLLRKMRQGELRRVLLAPTGALFSPLTTQQGESIPAICHALTLEAGDV